MNPRSVLITGTNRGIGLQLVRSFLELSSPPKHLIATCRNPDDAVALQSLAKEHKNITVLKLDCSNVEDDKVASFVSQVEEVLQGEGLNLLINNAGKLIREPVTAETLSDVFTVNAFAPLLITKALIPLLRKAADSTEGEGLSLSRAGVVNMSSKVGSIADNGKGGNYLYRGAKIALNMFNKNLSIEYGKDGLLFVLLHPGWVKTEMGGPNALISTEESVQGMMQMMEKCTEEHQARFFDYNGVEIPW